MLDTPKVENIPTPFSIQVPQNFSIMTKETESDGFQSPDDSKINQCISPRRLELDEPDYKKFEIVGTDELDVRP